MPAVPNAGGTCSSSHTGGSGWQFLGSPPAGLAPQPEESQSPQESRSSPVPSADPAESPPLSEPQPLMLAHSSEPGASETPLCFSEAHGHSSISTASTLKTSPRAASTTSTLSTLATVPATASAAVAAVEADASDASATAIDTTESSTEAADGDGEAYDDVDDGVPSHHHRLVSSESHHQTTDDAKLQPGTLEPSDEGGCPVTSAATDSHAHATTALHAPHDVMPAADGSLPHDPTPDDPAPLASESPATKPPASASLAIEAGATLRPATAAPRRGIHVAFNLNEPTPPPSPRDGYASDEIRTARAYSWLPSESRER